MPSLPQNNCDFDLGEIKQKITFQTINPSTIRIDKIAGENLHNSAVLVPIVENQNEVSLLFTLRSKALERHSGQVSFPGGIIEENDTSVIETALRETEEEIGIRRENIQVIGHLKPFNTSTGFIVFPVVGVIDSLDSINRNIMEVDRIFCIPLNWLCDPNHSRMQDFLGPDGKLRSAWHYDRYDGEVLWGITAKITKEFLEIIKK